MQQATNDATSLWRYVPIGDFREHDATVEATLQSRVDEIWQSLRTKPDDGDDIFQQDRHHHVLVGLPVVVSHAERAPAAELSPDAVRAGGSFSGFGHGPASCTAAAHDLGMTA